MRITLKSSLSNCLVALKKMTGQRDKWVRDWPGQVHLSLSSLSAHPALYSQWQL